MKSVLPSICLLFSITLAAQDSAHIQRPVFLYGLATYDLPKSYGFSIGTSFPFGSKIKNLTSSEKDEFVSAEFGEYRHPYGYTSIIFNAGIGIRYVRSPNHFTDLCFHQGVLRTVYDGKVYEMDQYGNIKELRFFGRTYLTTGFSYSMNWALHNRNQNLWFVQLKPSAWAQYPYNSFLKLHLSLQAGVSYRLKNINVRSRSKHNYSS